MEERNFQKYEDMIRKIAKYYAQQYNMEFEDVYQEACVGFFELSREYDAEISDSFEGYMFTHLRYYVSNKCRRASSGLGVSNGTLETRFGKAGARRMVPCGIRIETSTGYVFEDEVILQADVEAYNIRELLTFIPERYQYVLLRRYGLYDGEEWTLEEVARECGKSRERVRQMEAAGLRKMRNVMHREQKRNFF